MNEHPTPLRQLRCLTSADRTLPDFLIIGAQKSGSTALAVNLGLHPDVHMAGGNRPIETHFFDSKWDQGLEWYRKWFPAGDKLQAEKTPNYLPENRCHARMAEVVPHAKLIIALRNPVDRAFSAWNHFNQAYENTRLWGWEIMPFDEAIQSEVPSLRTLIRFGEYIKHIRHLLRFYPRQSIHILIAERLMFDRVNEYAKILDFLGLRQTEVPFRNAHVRQYAETMDPILREKLGDYFAPFNAELASFLGDPLPEWQ